MTNPSIKPGVPSLRIVRLLCLTICGIAQTVSADPALQPYAPHTIRIVDMSSNKPVPHFRFRWMEGTPHLPDTPEAKSDLWHEAVADANGNIEIQARMAEPHFEGNSDLYWVGPTLTVESITPGLVAKEHPQYCFFPIKGKLTCTIKVGPPCAVSGRVLDATTNAGFVGLSIKLQTPNRELQYEAISNTNGEYYFEAVLPGEYYVDSPRVAGYVNAFPNQGQLTLRAKTGYVISHADFPLERESLSKRTKKRFKLNPEPEPVGLPLTIRGVLFDRDGSLAANAKIAITPAKQTQPATSNARGEFTLKDVPPGTHKLEIIHQDHAYRKHWLDTSGSRIALVLQHPEPIRVYPPPISVDGGPSYSVKLYAVDALTGAPIQHYLCTWAHPNHLRPWRSDFGSGSISVFSADGSHIASRATWYLPFMVQVSAPGYASANQWMTSDLCGNHFDPPSVIVKLYPEAIINGQARDPNGAPVANARIVALALPGNEVYAVLRQQTPVAATDANGNFTITTLPLIPLTLTAFDDQWGRITAPLTPVSGQTQDVTLQFAPSTPLNIDLHCGDARQTDSTVELTFDDPRAQTEYGGEYSTDIDGRIKIPHALPSTGTAQARIHRENSRFTRARNMPFTTTRDEPTDLPIDFPPGCAALTGTIKIPGESVLRVTLQFHYKATAETITTDPIEGSWVVLNNLPAGDPLITATIRTDNGLHMRSLKTNLRPGKLTRLTIR